MATKKEKLSRFRNLTLGVLTQQKERLNKILSNLPEGKCLTPDERQILLQIRSAYVDVLGTWRFRSKELVSNVKENL